MSEERSFGLQWRQAVLYLVFGAGSSLAALTGYLIGRYFGLDPYTAVVLGFFAGLLIGLVGSITGSLIARSVKLRLWEAGRLASCIARGDYHARLDVGADDEVGWLEGQLNHMAVQLESAVESLKGLAEQNRRLGEEAGRGAALEERMRLARDLHDTVNQQLFVLAMRIAALKKRLEQAGNDAAYLVPEMNNLEELARNAHSQIRELILQIRPVTLEKEGLGAALKDYVNSIAGNEGWEVKIEIDNSIRPGGLVEECLFRVAQEALNNISKHAAAKKVGVVMVLEDKNIKLSINDDGTGFDPGSTHRPTAVGLAGIRERITAVNGRVDIKSAPGQGTELTVLVPIEKEGMEDQ